MLSEARAGEVLLPSVLISAVTCDAGAGRSGERRVVYPGAYWEVPGWVNMARSRYMGQYGQIWVNTARSDVNMARTDVDMGRSDPKYGQIGPSRSGYGRIGPYIRPDRTLNTGRSDLH